MARVPFVGRLIWTEYLALFFSLVLLFLEVPIRIITILLPQPVFQFCYNRSKSLFNRLSSPSSIRSRSRDTLISEPIANASDFTEICALAGYRAEEHVVQTADGYLLIVHRLPYKKGEDEQNVRVNAGPGSTIKPVIYLHHGLLMNSEVWVCISEEARCLPFALVERGYDVWLGNNRGNKYSKKSTRCSPASADFWNFSMDQFAFHDIPNSIDYVLDTVSQPSLSYIGFSQGTAQAFASLSIHPPLNDKINLFIALAPALSPAGLSNGVVDSLVKASPHVLFLAFGRKSILSSATFWQSILYPPLFVRLIDWALHFLFAWSGRNISHHQKLAAYPHLYSFTSTKSVVHWFQIIRNQSFQMYDDDSPRVMSIGASDRYYKVAKFPTRNIKTPIILVYGGSDSLVDIRAMLRELPNHTMAYEVPPYEHLDFLWARSVDKLVFPHVFDALQHYRFYPNIDLSQGRNGFANGATGLSFARDDTARLRLGPGNQSISSSGGEDDRSSVISYWDTPTPRGNTRQSAARQARDRQYRDNLQSTPFSSASTTSSPTSPIQSHHSNGSDRQQSVANVRPLAPWDPSRHSTQTSLSSSPSASASHRHNHVSPDNPTTMAITGSPASSLASKKQSHTLLSHLFSTSKPRHKLRPSPTPISGSRSESRSISILSRPGSTSSSQASNGTGTRNGNDSSTTRSTSTFTAAATSRTNGSGNKKASGRLDGTGSVNDDDDDNDNDNENGNNTLTSTPSFSTTGIKLGAGRPSVGIGIDSGSGNSSGRTGSDVGLDSDTAYL